MTKSTHKRSSESSYTTCSGRRALTLLLFGVFVAETLAFVPSTYPQHFVLSLTRFPHYAHHEQQQQQKDTRTHRIHDVALWGSRSGEQNTDTSKLTDTDVTTVVIDQEDEEETYKTAFRNTILAIAVSVLFGAGLWATAGPVVGQEFFAGYIVEKSLSVDNLFVFLLLFDYFQVPTPYQNRILSWGIYGSIVMRAIMIGLGAAALMNFRGILLVFAGILIYSAFQVLVDVRDDDNETENDLSNNPVVMFSRYLCDSKDSCDLDEFDENQNDSRANPVVIFSRSLFPSTNVYDGDRFFTIEDGIKKATPLFVCMIAVELSDVVFAVDSIPAVFGVTEVSEEYETCSQ
jgi:predicted tellurium resistance membrane protein TerC